MHTCMPACMHKHACTHMCTHTCTHTQTRIDAHMHTRTHSEVGSFYAGHGHLNGIKPSSQVHHCFVLLMPKATCTQTFFWFIYSVYALCFGLWFQKEEFEEGLVPGQFLVCRNMRVVHSLDQLQASRQPRHVYVTSSRDTQVVVSPCWLSQCFVLWTDWLNEHISL